MLLCSDEKKITAASVDLLLKSQFQNHRSDLSIMSLLLNQAAQLGIHFNNGF